MSDSPDGAPTPMSNEQGFAFINACTERELRDALTYLQGFTPLGVAYAKRLIDRTRDIGRQAAALEIEV